MLGHEADYSIDIQLPYATATPLPELQESKEALVIDDEGSVYGINEGRISKLTIKIGNKVTANYDREWDIKPAETDKATQIAYSILLNDYN